MKLFSLQKSEYPGKGTSYTCHFETGNARHPYAMLNLSEDQYKALLQSFKEIGIATRTEEKEYATIDYL